ncbi:DUF418 domain-containing protein [Streptosporangium roseum]|uniref:DUF418 domain-containing protein n=1 Tax=Streptosporangium roseum (strain ATCC 12428 / DSM 43021 / JCM 3005 / KCTC 9067 / NCIMB 10171 / NRRL 2505 / NI 9100) TaxID=479432 RepID=D2B262_STRRD|nr:DUF418 domain-containing protein [Streptosporangium roseum]ACZ89286.1 conserved hypothetical protein [Streptosporangium roseum DSM 43021]
MTRRLHELDALRGFAVCGIMLVNTWQHTREQLGAPDRNAVDWAIDNLLQSRFYPIFSFLFGLSFVLFLRSAAERTDHPRVVLLRRLAVLACFGLVHQLVNPGEVLLPYAIFGVLVLLPASFLPRPAVPVLGLAVTAWAVHEGGGMKLIPGLFLLGMAVMEYPPPEWLLPPSFAVSAVLAVGLGYLWIRTLDDPGLFYRGTYPAAGLAAAVAYCTGLLLLLRSRPRDALLAVLAPLGRMALTNYLVSTAVILLALPLLTADPTRIAGVLLSAGVLALQVVLSRKWLARFRYGPLEWLWRRLTWMEAAPNRRIGSNA